MIPVVILLFVTSALCHGQRDATPDPFSFPTVADTAPSAVVQSVPVTITGINTTVKVVVIGGEYSVQGAAYTSKAGSIRDSQTLRLRGTASAVAGAEVYVEIKVGTASVRFTIRTATLSSAEPSAFAFLDKIKVDLNSLQESEEIVVGGLPGPVPIQVTGGDYSVDGGGFTASSGMIGNGQRVKLRVQAPSGYNQQATATLHVGEAAAEFTVRTPLYAPSDCPEKNIGSKPSGGRWSFAFPDANGLALAQQVTSQCVTMKGAGSGMAIRVQRGQYSINGQAFTSATGTIKDGDQLRVRVTASSSYDTKVWETIYFDNLALGAFTLRTRNDERPPQTFQVGPSKTYRELNAVTSLLREGDLVEVQGDAIYQPVTFTRSGSPAKPIRVRGVAVNGKRPLISGGDRTVRFEESHNIVFENFEVTGGTDICVRTMADNVTIRDVWVHGCIRHGILGADNYSGAVTIDRVEVSDAGGLQTGEAAHHAIYIATDRDRFPGSRLRVQHSFIHDYRGNGIKSRAERNEIYYNWIEPGGTDSIYSMELVGYEVYEPVPRIDSDIAGNAIVHRGPYGIRLGGDGTGASRGRVRLVNNTILATSAMDSNTAVVRLYQAIDSVMFINNVFARLGDGSQPKFRLMRADSLTWASGVPKVAGRVNWMPTGTTIELGSPAEWTGTITGSTNPGLTNISSATALDMTLTASSVLAGTATPDLQSNPGYEIANPRLALNHRPSPTRPAPGQYLPVYFLKTGTHNIGAE